jgi:hypothetical protein
MNETKCYVSVKGSEKIIKIIWGIDFNSMKLRSLFLIDDITIHDQFE